jgi:hypothetical protein
MRVAVAVVLLVVAACREGQEQRKMNREGFNLTEYRVLLDAEDDAGPFFITLRIAAEGPGRAEALAKEWTERNDARLIGVDEVEPKQLLPGAEPGVVGKTGRAYYKSE